MKNQFNDLFNMIFDLAFSNRSIGLWDNKRFTECKKDLHDIDLSYLYESEKNTRKYLEIRSKSKNAIDEIIYNKKL